MAIDTAEKRRASIGFGMPQSAGTLIPSGATSAFRRGSGLGLYSVDGAAAVAFIPGTFVEVRSRSFAVTDRGRTAVASLASRTVTVEQNR